MKVLHVVPYLPKASGVTTFVVECSDVLQKMGVAQVVAIKDRQHFEVASSRADVPRIGVEEALARIGKFDVVHLHGIWPPFLHRFVVAARRQRVPIVWSLHGMLSPWAMKFKWWKKALPWLLWQKRDLTAAAILHVTSEKESDWVRACGFKSRIVNIPLGTDMPEPPAVRRHEKKTLLFVGRINPVKGLENLIQAWKFAQCDDWKLRLVGTDEAKYTAKLVTLAQSLSLQSSVEFPGPKFGKDLDAEYQNADAFVLPSFTENFGGVVVDALAWGLPVITSKGTPWREVEGAGGEGRGSRSRLTAEFVNLEPGDTFDQIEQYLRGRVSAIFENKTLGIVATIGSKRNANELAKHMAAGESPEAHKFAAKNIGALFERGVVGFTHLDKKATPGQRWITRFVRVVSFFDFDGERFVATLTLKAEREGGRLYAVEAVEINQDAKLRSTPRGAMSKDLNSAPILNLTSQLTNRIAYYVGDVNRTHPAFLGRSEPFSIERAVDLIHGGGDDKSKLGVEVEEKGRGRGNRSTVELHPSLLASHFDSLTRFKDLAEKRPEELTFEEKSEIVHAIETTEMICLEMPKDEKITRFLKGYWDGDAKVIREIVDWGSGLVPVRVINRYIGEIQTHKNSIRSTLFHTRFRGPLKVLILERLADVLKDAVLYNKGRDGDETFYNLAHRLRFDPGDGKPVKEFIVRLIVKETAEGNRTWTVEFSNKKELTGMPTTGEAATVEVTHLKSPSTHTILKLIYAVNAGEEGRGVRSTVESNDLSRCGWWVDNDPETLAKALREAMSLSDEERRQMGEVGRRLVEAKYTWSAVAKKMGECYESLKV